MNHPCPEMPTDAKVSTFETVWILSFGGLAIPISVCPFCGQRLGDKAKGKEGK